MKNKIEAKIIADSLSPKGKRITSFKLTFPRFILAELNTHRVFSRNSSSSRAIPFKTMVDLVKNDPFIPIAWQKDHKGMQGNEYFDGFKAKLLEKLWLVGRNLAVKVAKKLNAVGLTKQLCNRILEPFLWHTAIVTTTDLENFFALRCPQYEFKDHLEMDVIRTHRSKKDAVKEFPAYKDLDKKLWLELNKGQGEIHIMELAEAMYDAYKESLPKPLSKGEWHIPFGDKFDQNRILELFEDEGSSPIEFLKEVKIKIATARCARVSYLNFEGKDDYKADIKLHDRLSNMGHWSPFEHCARPLLDSDSKDLQGNLNGFVQYRKTFLKENLDKIS